MCVWMYAEFEIEILVHVMLAAHMLREKTSFDLFFYCAVQLLLFLRRRHFIHFLSQYMYINGVHAYRLYHDFIWIYFEAWIDEISMLSNWFLFSFCVEADGTWTKMISNAISQSVEKRKPLLVFLRALC